MTTALSTRATTALRYALQLYGNDVELTPQMAAHLSYRDLMEIPNCGRVTALEIALWSARGGFPVAVPQPRRTIPKPWYVRAKRWILARVKP